MVMAADADECRDTARRVIMENERLIRQRRELANALLRVCARPSHAPTIAAEALNKLKEEEGWT